jgi:hypothetical protein
MWWPRRLFWSPFDQYPPQLNGYLTGFQERTVVCVACGGGFLMTVEDQWAVNYQQRKPWPSRCAACAAS